MMTSTRNVAFLLPVLASAVGASSSNSQVTSPYPERPEFPTNAHELRATANERLMVSVQSVETDYQQRFGSTVCYERDLVTATVIGSTGANAKFQPGDEVQFYNEFYDLESLECRHPEGGAWPYEPPASSPKIAKDWCGIAYLDFDEDIQDETKQSQSPLMLAAFWDSLDQFNGECPPLPGNVPVSRSGSKEPASPYPFSPEFPTNTHELRADADERLMISVQSVETDFRKAFAGTVCYQRDLVTAFIIGTTGANTKFQPGEEVRFYNEVYDLESQGCTHPDGPGATWPHQPPASSPKIAKDWCGISYLNFNKIEDEAQGSQSPLLLAAVWDSLDQFDGECPPLPEATANRHDDGPFNRRGLRGNRQ